MRKAKFLDRCLHYDKNIRFKTGVYIIYHTKYPDKIYVGSAAGSGKYRGFYNRLSSHYSDLVRKVHCNAKLQNMVNKYGIEGIRFIPLEIYPPDLCVAMEQYYINMFQPYYNINTQANNTLGYKHTQEYLDKCRKNLVQYDIDGNFIKKHSGIANTERKLNVFGIHECCVGRYRKAHNYIWKYIEDVTDENNNIIKKINPYENTTAMKITAYELNGDFYKVYGSILEASQELNLNTGNISRSVSKETRKCGKYIFRKYRKNYAKKIKPYIRYHKNQLKVIIQDIETKEKFEYSSFRKAGNSNQISRSTLSTNYNKGIKEFTHSPYESDKKYKVIIEDYN